MNTLDVRKAYKTSYVALSMRKVVEVSTKKEDWLTVAVSAYIRGRMKGKLVGDCLNENIGSEMK